MADGLILLLAKGRVGWRPCCPSGFISQANRSQSSPRFGSRGFAADLGLTAHPRLRPPLFTVYDLDEILSNLKREAN